MKLTFRGTASALLALVGLSAIASAMRYLTLDEFTPVHAALLGRKWAQLDADLQEFVLASLRINGAAQLGGGAALLVFSWRTAKGDVWAAFAALLVAVAVWSPILYVALWHRIRHPEVQTPVGMIVLLLALVSAAALLAWAGRRTSPLAVAAS